MCGFCGFTGTTDDNETIIENMINSIAHRGPDSSGVHLDKNITLGFRRLSIIDIQDGSQPLYNEDRSIVLVFNGEIYNYKVLRDKLIKKGHKFSTHTDSEVLIHLYEESGEEFLNELRGMFSFVIWDSKKEIVFAARDYFGIKPFYYTFVDGEIVFASEIKGILKHPLYKRSLNEEAFENYLTFQYSVLPETLFKGIYKLMPAHYLKFDSGKLSTHRYWEPYFKEEECSLEKAVDSIDKILADSIEAHKISDVEVGSFLSSGVDSSFVAASFNGAKTFTVGFDYDNYNEIGYAKKLSEKVGIDNYSKTITKEEYWDVLPKVMYHMDEPLADASAVALFFLSEMASKHVKVALSGEGADELFGGYNIYREPLSLSPITKLPMFIRKALGAIVSIIPFSFKGKSFFIRASQKVEQRFIGNYYTFTKKERDDLLKNPKCEYEATAFTKQFYDKVKNKDDITKMQYLDLCVWLVGDILLKADKMSMANSLEVRVPFLDKEVFKIAAALGTKHRVTKKSTKYAFRLASKKRLPENVAHRRKLGFPVPIRLWLREEKYYNIVKKKFQSDSAGKYFKSSEIIKLLDDHKNNKKDNTRKIWTIYIFLIWYDQYFDEGNNGE